MSRRGAARMNDVTADTTRHDDTFTAHGITYHHIRISPVAQPIARLAVVHGYGDHAGRYVETMTWLASRGIACDAFDMRGHGRSSGRRAYVQKWDEYLDDLDAFLSVIPDAIPRFILGHSHGGLVVAAAGISGLLARQNVVGCILTAPYFVNAFPVPRHKSVAARVANVVWPWVRIKSGINPEMTSSDPAMIEDSRQDGLLLRCATPRWYLGQRRAQLDAMRRAAEFKQPLLVIQGDADPIADPRGSRQFHDRAGSTDKTFIEYPGFRHEPLRETGRERVFADVFEWIERHAINERSRAASTVS